MFNLDFAKNYNKQSHGINIYVKPVSGNDGNTGLTPDAAVKTLAKALTIATANQNDTVYMFAEGNSASATTDYQSVTLTWNKDMVHLVGVNCGPLLGQRSRIAFVSTYDTASNLFTLTADHCRIENIEFFAGVAGTNPTGCLLINGGQRNHFKNCQISGIGNDNNDIAGAYSLYLKGNATENVFEDCVIGLDTVSRGSADSIYEIYMNTDTGVVSGAKPARNVFRRCYIIGLASSTSQYFFLKIASGGADRFVMFDQCTFINASSNVGGGATPAYAFSVASDANGVVILKDSCVVGASELADNPGNVWTNVSLATAADAGKAVVATKS